MSTGNFTPTMVCGDSNQMINIKVIKDILRGKISDVVPELHAITICNTKSHRLNTEKVHVFKRK